jgi:hypothetical protein
MKTKMDEFLELMEKMSLEREGERHKAVQLGILKGVLKYWALRSEELNARAQEALDLKYLDFMIAPKSQNI